MRDQKILQLFHMRQGRSTPYIGDGHPTLIGNPLSWHMEPYYKVDDPYLLGKQREFRQRTCGRFNPRDNAPATGGGVTTNCSKCNTQLVYTKKENKPQKG